MTPPADVAVYLTSDQAIDLVGLLALAIALCIGCLGGGH
jgi:hypothetical protein